MFKLILVIFGLSLSFHAWAGDTAKFQVSVRVVEPFEMDREIVIPLVHALARNDQPSAMVVIDPVAIGLPADVRVEVLPTPRENIYILAIDF